MSFLRIKNLCLKFGDWTLDVSIELAAGRCLGIIGPSGAGKSTLLSLIAGFETPYSGDIFIDAQPINDLEPSHRPVTFMFQENNLFNHLTLYENIALGCGSPQTLSWPRPNLLWVPPNPHAANTALAHLFVGPQNTSWLRPK